MMFAKLCAIILIFMVVGSHSLQVFVGNTTKHFFTPAFAGNKSPIINGQIISYIGVLGLSAKDLQTCDKASPSAFVNQSIAIVAPFGGCATERHIEVAQNAGAVAVIIVTDQMWRVCQTTDVDSKSFKNRINAVCITREDFNVLIAILINNGNQNPPQPTIAIFSADPNEYQTKLNKRLMDWGTITFFIVFVGIGGVSVFRLVQFFMKEGISFTIPKLLLIINIYATLTSAITVIDLQGYRNWYNTMQFQTTYYYFLSSAALYQFIIFSGYVANILVKVSEHKKLVNIANYSITGFFMVGYTVVNIVLCIYGYTWNLNKAVGDGSIIVIAIISGMSSLFFLFASIFLIAKLTSFVSLTSGKSEERKKKYVMLSALLMFAFVVILGACVLTIAIAFKSVQDDIQAFFVIYFLLNCCIVIWHSIVILVFNPRDAQKRSNSSTGTKSLKKSSEFNRSFNENNKSFNSLDKIDDGAEL